MANRDRSALFHRAIMESGASTARAVYPYDNPLHVQQFSDFINAVGCSDIGEDSLISHLRTLPLSTIVSASLKVYEKFNPSNRWAFQPTIEGHGGYISQAPIDAWRSGNWHKVPILTGFNTNEGASFVSSSMSKSAQFRSFFQTLLPGLSASELDQIEQLYPDPSTDPTSLYVETRRGVGKQYKRVEAAYGQWAYISPVRQTVHFATTPALGNSTARSTNTNVKVPIYLYHFAVNKTIYGGASHGDQGEYVTHSQSIVKFSKSQGQIASQMHAYWTSFILTSDPNAVKGDWPDRPVWPAYDAAGVNGQKMVFGEGNNEWTGGKDTGTPAKVTDDTWMRKECEFWWSKTEISER